MEPFAATTGWLAESPVAERIQLDDASWLDTVRALIPRADGVHKELLTSVEWQQGGVFRYERYVDSPRLMASCPTGTHPAIDEVSAWIRRRYRVPFGSPALALYRDERDSVGFHRDRELRWLDDTIIVVLTFGARRPWVLRPRKARRFGADDLSDARDLSPASGDLLVMGGATQNRWLHGVPKVGGRCASRISVQWRWTSRRGQRDMNPSFYAPRRYSRR